MKSSDYFSKVYGPAHESTKRSPEVEKKIAAIKKASAKMEMEKMLNWLFDSTNQVFDQIEKPTLKAFLPDEVQFRFFHKSPRDIVYVQLIKYLPGTDQFFNRRRKTIDREFSFPRSFSSVPEYYRKKWDDPITVLRNGYFEVTYSHALRNQVSFARISENEYVGKFKAVFTGTIDYGSEYKGFSRKV